MTVLFSPPSLVFSTAILLRIILLFYGLYQDAHSPMKYTDIDYIVFTDAARYVSRGYSPYLRDTYRYTPLLSWALLPTAWRGGPWFSFGKILFAIADVVAGWLIVLVLKENQGMDTERALKYASIWLLNPMVATISTRGSSEGLLGVMVMALLFAVLQRRVTLAGILLGFAVHFKIYPFIYAPSIFWWLQEEPRRLRVPEGDEKRKPWSSDTAIRKLQVFFNPSRVTLALTALSTFSALNLSMYIIYGVPFMQHTYLHHLTRIDHRHNFSPYNTLLYLSSSSSSAPSDRFNFESLAFIPQLLLSAGAIPFVLAKKDLAGAMLAQTFAFVTFNKVCTSQYFLWYMIFLPLYLPKSSFLKSQSLGLSAGSLWVLAQTMWLQQAYQLEFLGRSTFVPGLWAGGLSFFVVNVLILEIIVGDIGKRVRRD